MTAVRISPSGPDVEQIAAVLTSRYGQPIDISTDAFGGLRISELQTIFETKQVDPTLSSLLMQNVVTGGGSATYNASRASTMLATDGTTSRALRQSKRYLNYQPGKSQKIDITFCLHGIASGQVARIGYFDDNNGLFYEHSGQLGPGFVVRSDVSGAVVDTRIEQEDWNLDPLDGTGVSGFTLDPFTVQIFTTFFEWLGVGGVFFGFFIDNRFVPCHFQKHANLTTSVYMRSPDLPVRWELLDSTGIATSELESICADVGSEGGFEPFGVSRADYITTAVTTASATIRELLSIRLRCDTTTDAGKVETRSTVFPERFTVLNTSNDAGNAVLLCNPTFTGAGTWAAPPGADSLVQVSKTGRLITNVGTVLESTLFSAQVRSSDHVLDRLLALSGLYDGTPNVLTLALVNTNGGSTDSLGSISWREL